MEVKKVLEQVKKGNIKFITLQFTDLLGVIKEVIIPVEELEDALTDGVWFDGSSIEGFARIQESDLFLKPDTATYAVVPWLTEDGKTARLICGGTPTRSKKSLIPARASARQIFLTTAPAFSSSFMATA